MTPWAATQSVSTPRGALMEGTSVGGAPVRTDAGVPQIGAVPTEVVTRGSDLEGVDTLPGVESARVAAGRRPPTTNEAMSAKWIILYRGPVIRGTRTI